MCILRGKLSEGIDLPDKLVRLAFIISIPYSPVNDKKVVKKREVILLFSIWMKYLLMNPINLKS